MCRLFVREALPAKSLPCSLTPPWLCSSSNTFLQQGLHSAQTTRDKISSSQPCQQQLLTTKKSLSGENNSLNASHTTRTVAPNISSLLPRKNTGKNPHSQPLSNGSSSHVNPMNNSKLEDEIFKAKKRHKIFRCSQFSSQPPKLTSSLPFAKQDQHEEYV